MCGCCCGGSSASSPRQRTLRSGCRTCSAGCISCWAGGTVRPSSGRGRSRAGWKTCRRCSTTRAPRWSRRCACSWRRRCASTRAGWRWCAKWRPRCPRCRPPRRGAWRPRRRVRRRHWRASRTISSAGWNRRPTSSRWARTISTSICTTSARCAARFDGGKRWQDVADRLRADHPPAAALVAAYAEEMRRARDFVAARGLAAIPDAPLDVVPTPAFMRPIIPFAAYDSPGPYSRDRTGWFYVTIPDSRLPAAAQERMLRDHCRHGLAATALHEGYPGHHLHLVQAQRQASETRKNVSTPLTVEGWALYCEDMMGEEGFYRSEEEQFFQRVHLLWRAVRILLDVGLHTRGMTFEQAVEYLTSHLRVDRANAEAEVRRYCAEPAYPLCYAVGRREILKLRDDFRAARGSAFTLRAFHDAILRYGGLPVTLMRWGLGLNE